MVQALLLGLELFALLLDSRAIYSRKALLERLGEYFFN